MENETKPTSHKDSRFHFWRDKSVRWERLDNMAKVFPALVSREDSEVFRASVAIILPICVVSIVMAPYYPPLGTVLPYLLGSCAGGLLAPKIARHIPTLWLHRALGLLILWGGVRYLWP